MSPNLFHLPLFKQNKKDNGNIWNRVLPSDEKCQKKSVGTILIKIGKFVSSNQEFLLLVLLLQKNWPKIIVVYILANRPLASTWLPLIKTSISGNCSISVENLQYFHNSFPNTTTLFNILFENDFQILYSCLWESKNTAEKETSAISCDLCLTKVMKLYWISVS